MISLADFRPLKTNRGFTERYFSDKVHAILIEEVPFYTSNLVLNIVTLTCNV